MARDPSRNVAQAHALYAFHQQGKARVERTARRLVVSPRTVYALTENQVTTPACILGPLWDEYGDEKLIAALIGATTRPFIFAAAPTPELASSSTAATCAVIGKAGHVLEDAARALEDGRIDPAEAAHLVPELDALERSITTLVAALRAKR